MRTRNYYEEDNKAHLDPWMMSARSFVIFPDSTAPIHAASSFSVKSKSLSFLSNVALFTSILLSTHNPPQLPKLSRSTNIVTYLCASPRVQAKIEAMLFVLVSPPFWWTLKWRVTVPWAASASMVLPSGHTWTIYPQQFRIQNNEPYQQRKGKWSNEPEELSYISERTIEKRNWKRHN